jgi:hypothetical protein
MVYWSESWPVEYKVLGLNPSLRHCSSEGDKKFQWKIIENFYWRLKSDIWFSLRLISYIPLTFQHRFVTVFPKFAGNGRENSWGGDSKEKSPLSIKKNEPEPVFLNLLRSPGIDSLPGGPIRHPYLSCRPARLHRHAESNPRNRFLGSLNVYKYGLSWETEWWW